MSFENRPDELPPAPTVVRYAVRTRPSARRVLRGALVHLDKQIKNANPRRRYYGLADLLETRHILYHLFDGVMFCTACPAWYQERMGARG